MKLRFTLPAQLILGLALALVAPMLHAEEGTAGGATPPAVAGKKHNHAKLEKENGVIDKVDVDGKSITVAGKTFKLSDKARVRIDGVEKQLADLKTGDVVTVKYSVKPDGSMVAHSVNMGAKKKK